MMDVDKLIDHLRYGVPYTGDVQRDTLDALERLAEAEARYETLQERVEEARGQFPEEDFLSDVIATLTHVRDGSKSEMGDAIADVIDQLEALQGEISGQTEYARELLK